MPSPKLQSPRLKLVLVALCGTLVALLTRPTLAYFTTTGHSTNVVTTGDIKIELLFTTNHQPIPAQGYYVMPGTVLQREISVQNTGTHPCWVRIALSYDENGQPIQQELVEPTLLNEQDWIYRGGYYYYTSILEPLCTTSELCEFATVSGRNTGNDLQNKTIQMTVTAYAVQSENNGQEVGQAAGWPASPQEGAS